MIIHRPTLVQKTLVNIYPTLAMAYSCQALPAPWITHASPGRRFYDQAFGTFADKYSEESYQATTAIRANIHCYGGYGDSIEIQLTNFLCFLHYLRTLFLQCFHNCSVDYCLAPDWWQGVPERIDQYRSLSFQATGLHHLSVVRNMQDRCEV